MTLLELDARSRVVIPGHADERFLMRENPDGSILLEPALIVTKAQAEYDNSPELQAVLGRAMSEPTVRRPRRQRRTT
jgi:hypothetical protein